MGPLAAEDSLTAAEAADADNRPGRHGKSIIAFLKADHGCSPENPAGGPWGNSMIYHVEVEAGEAGNRRVECRVRNHVVRADQPREFGADDTAPTPPELLATALGSCVVSTVQFLAMQRGRDVRNIRVTVEGEIDFSKAVGLGHGGRAGFRDLKIRIGFDSAMTREERADFMKAVFDCGACIDSLQNPTPISWEWRSGE